MKLIVGLGNPGKQYIQSRHNIGFIAIDKLTNSLNLDLKVDSKFNAAYVKTKIGTEDVIIAKPLTYMNLSGQAVVALMNYFKIDISNLLVILDDTALPLSKVRIRQTGSHGGQNGLKDIINKLGTKDFKRIRVGIGSHDHMDKVDFVLGKFSQKELDILIPSIHLVEDAILDWIKEDNFNNVMTKYNTPQTT
ncbi:aminoacyl-tRNA hydrolase [Acholeplasma granularum]|uniref:aminoacyl-tRNA hydrolase n=1 Tax=Acholeplasma granularum TaxID=264635 RepID=UPI000471ABAC|nr:aminoacyl-tRNA hydrolase [Acholeplasma granularum]